MKVKHSISFNITNDGDIEFEYFIGEVIRFIPGDNYSPDKFIVVDDKSGDSLEIKVCECFKID